MRRNIFFFPSFSISTRERAKFVKTLSNINSLRFLFNISQCGNYSISSYSASLLATDNRLHPQLAPKIRKNGSELIGCFCNQPRCLNETIRLINCLRNVNNRSSVMEMRSRRGECVSAGSVISDEPNVDSLGLK